MTRSWDSVKDLLHRALQLAPERRGAFLEQACASDLSLRAEVESLLAADDQLRSSFLESPPLAGGTLVDIGGCRLEAGQTFAQRFRLVRKLGEGGMGQVWLAEQMSPVRRQVALKLIKAGMYDQSTVQRFEAERQSLAIMDHPAIAKVFDAGTTEQGQPFFVMDYVPGVPINEYCDRKKLSIKQRLQVFVQACEGVQHAHQKAIIHRDLKPANMLVVEVDGKSKVRIIDFGLAKATALAGGGSVVTHLGTFVGTPAYMSPEQADPRDQEIDPRTDVYSLGVVLYDLLTGELPLDLTTQKQPLDQVLRALREEEPSRPSSRVSGERTRSSVAAAARASHPAQLASQLRGDLDWIALKALEKDRSRRYSTASELAADVERYLTGIPVKARKATLPYRTARFLRRHTESSLAVVVMLGIIALAAAVAYFAVRKPAARLTEKDSVVLGDFTNRTGEAVFDDALKQALAVELRQSPFLNILPDEKVREFLQKMGRPPDDRVEGQVARELCQRSESKALLTGSISTLGSFYLVGLEAVACGTGDILDEEQVEAHSREEVLKVLGRASISLRARLGESLPSLQKFDFPVAATTSSLDALKSYSLGIKILKQQGEIPAIPFLKRAVELDPGFPLAHAALATVYSNQNQPTLGLEYARKAYELRDRIGGRERMVISAAYLSAIGETEKENELYQLWMADYPRDYFPDASLSVNYLFMGQPEKALELGQQALRLFPENSSNYTTVGGELLFLNRLNDAQSILKQASARGITDTQLNMNQYLIAFLQGNTAEMEQLFAEASGKPGEGDGIISMKSDTEAYHGRIHEARTLTRRAVSSSIQAGAREAGAAWQINTALRDAELGNEDAARHEIAAALALSQGRDVKAIAALALARIGDAHRADVLSAELARENSTGFFITRLWLPVIHAAIQLKQGKPALTIQNLEPIEPYELSGLPWFNLYPAYLRGQAYLQQHNGAAAVAEFQKLLDHPGVITNFVTGALAHLQIGRAYAVAGDKNKAKSAYQDFFSIWKDADPDTLMLKQAKAEYARLDAIQ